MYTANLNKARMMVKGEDGEFITLAGPAEDRFIVGEQTRFTTTITFALKAESESLRRLFDVRGNGRFPIDLTTPTRVPKRRRHARGGLRPMVAARVRKFIAHGMDIKGDTTGAP